MTTAMAGRPAGTEVQEGLLARIAIGFTGWAERWFPDAFIFVAIAVVIVALAAIINGASPLAVSVAFGNGFWSLITFTMQMAFVAIGGYVPDCQLRVIIYQKNKGPQISAGLGAVCLKFGLMTSSGWHCHLRFRKLVLEGLVLQFPQLLDQRPSPFLPRLRSCICLPSVGRKLDDRGHCQTL